MRLIEIAVVQVVDAPWRVIDALWRNSLFGVLSYGDSNVELRVFGGVVVSGGL